MCGDHVPGLAQFSHPTGGGSVLTRTQPNQLLKARAAAAVTSSSQRQQPTPKVQPSSSRRLQPAVQPTSSRPALKLAIQLLKGQQPLLSHPANGSSPRPHTLQPSSSRRLQPAVQPPAAGLQSSHAAAESSRCYVIQPPAATIRKLGWGPVSDNGRPVDQGRPWNTVSDVQFKCPWAVPLSPRPGM